MAKRIEAEAMLLNIFETFPNIFDQLETCHLFRT